jgi:hypothetical protein
MGGTAPDFSGFTYQGAPPLAPQPDPTQNQPADFSSFGPPITSTDMGSVVGGQPGTQNLENQIGPAQQTLGNALHNPQTQPQTGQQPGQAPNFQDPLGPMLNDLVQKHQQLMAQQQPPSQGSPIKNLLRNFFSGAGDSMMTQAGLPSPNLQRLQLENQITSLSNARSLYMDRQSELASRQLQQQFMSTPLSPEVANAIGHPELNGKIVPPALWPVISNEDRGLEAAKINAQQRQDALDQNKITLPPTKIDAAMASTLGFPELAGKTLSTSQDYAALDKIMQFRGLQKVDKGFDGPQGGMWVMDRAGNPIRQLTPISESKRALQANAPPKPLADAAKPVIGFDTDGNQVLTNGANAQQLGLSEARDVGQAEAEKVTNARSLLPVFNNPNPADRGAIQLAQDLDRQGKLGPIASRYQEFMAGQFGQGDPEVEELRTKMGLLATGLMQVHVGARGSAQMLEHFEDMANAKKMDGPTLLSGLNAENNYVTRKAMIPKNSRFNSGIASTGAGTGNTQSTPTQSSGHQVGDLITQNGRTFKATQVDGNGKVLAADPQ